MSCKIGGVRRDIPEPLLAELLQVLERLETEYAEVLPTFVKDDSVRRRMSGVGVLAKDKAYELGAAGPVAKACGLAMDLRETGYAAYGALTFKPVTHTSGDCYARTWVRAMEIVQSIELIRQAVKQIPAGPFSVPVKGNPDGEVASRIEQPRGDLIFYIKGNGTRNLARFKARMPTYANLVPLLHMLPGNQLADVPVIVLSIDPCISCTER